MNRPMKNLYLFAALILCGFFAQAGERIFTTSDGVDLYVKVEGQGTPLLYLHGGPGSGSHWFEEYMGEFMEQYFTVVYLDQRGVGRSSNSRDGNYSMDRMALDFEELRNELGFDNWLTLGHSFGGILQMGYAERYPEAIKGMLMINCTLDIIQTACESWVPKAAEFLGEEYSCEGDSVSPRERMMEYGGRLREKGLFWNMGYAYKENYEKLESTYNAIPDFKFEFGNAVMNSDEYFYNYKPLASKMTMPVLFYYGSEDWMIGPRHHEDLEFPKLMKWESQVGHMPFLESKEDLEKAILMFSGKYGFTHELRSSK